METPARIEPCGIEENIPEILTELAHELRAAAAIIGQGLHPDTIRALRPVVDILNAHASNMIEGHAACPVEIEVALAGRPGNVSDPDLADEGRAHVLAQRWIDERAARGELPLPWHAHFIREVHFRLYEEMPTVFRMLDRRGSKIEPGAFRAAGQEVRVGDHLPPSVERVPAFMSHFSTRYDGITRGATGRILAIPAAHHRLNYIHPFPDGNGRVSRLVSHAMCHHAGLDGQGLWSISRALMCGADNAAQYRERMASADTPRRGDRDGRGNLSLQILEGCNS